MKKIMHHIQKFGRTLSAMVMPNIGAFIAWGLITALFIPTGWLPNEHLALLVSPMITYLIPLLIGYMAGYNIYSTRGGIAAAIATFGVIQGAGVPMLIGAMIMGPLGAVTIKMFDRHVGKKTKAGFEMLVNNFSLGILGMLLALFGYLVVGGIVESITMLMGHGVGWLVAHHLLPLVAILVEPAKVLFMNNAINHGIFTPMGIEQVAETGKSIFFLIEANPGAGLGLLLAYMAFGKGNARASAAGATVIHFLGGIHEIYFPYVLIKPKLLVALIAGGMVNIVILLLTGAGLVAPASPGSIIAISLVAGKGSLGGVYLAVIGSTLVSFVIASFILKNDKSDLQDELDDVIDKINHTKEAIKRPMVKKNYAEPLVIVVACDAGMGSSAMGANFLAKIVKDKMFNATVSNSAISNLTGSEDIIITHQRLLPLIVEKVPAAKHYGISNLLDKKFYNNLVDELNNERSNNEN